MKRVGFAEFIKCTGTSIRSRSQWAAVGLMALVMTGCAGGPIGVGGDPDGAIGVYDSRAVAIAYVGSDHFKTWMADLRKEHDEAKASGDQDRAKELWASAVVRQDQLHKQGFGTAGVGGLLLLIDAETEEIKKQAGLVFLVSKWDKKRMRRFSRVRKVDVTMALVDAFEPDEIQRKSAIEILDKKPVPLTELEQHQD